MKTAEEYFELVKEQIKSEDRPFFAQILNRVIRLAQEDAYNQAIEDATSQECDFVMEDEKGVVCNSIEWIKSLKKF